MSAKTFCIEVFLSYASIIFPIFIITVLMGGFKYCNKNRGTIINCYQTKLVETNYISPVGLFLCDFSLDRYFV